MSRVNIIPLGGNTVQPLPVRANRDDLLGSELALRQRQLASAERESEEDRELRELAILLGAEQTQATLDITRDQLKQQGTQFSETLGLREDEFAEQTRLRERELSNFETQLETMTAQADRAADREQITSVVTNSLALGNAALQSGVADVQERAEEFRNTAQGFNDVFAGRVNEVRTIMSNVSDNSTLDRNIADIENAVDSFSRSLRNAITDENLAPEQSFGALTAIVGESVFGGRLLDVLEGDLLALREVAGRGNRKRIDKIVKGLRTTERELLVPALQANARFEQALRTTGEVRELSRQNLRFTEDVTTAAGTARAEGGTLEPFSPTIQAPQLPANEFSGAIEALRNQLNPQIAGPPGPGAGGGNLPPAVREPDPFQTEFGAAIEGLARPAAETAGELAQFGIGMMRGERGPFGFADATPAAKAARGKITQQRAVEQIAAQNVTAHRKGGPITVIGPNGETFQVGAEAMSAFQLQDMKNKGFQVPGF